jgi:hypothetical protein
MFSFEINILAWRIAIYGNAFQIRGRSDADQGEVRGRDMTYCPFDDFGNRYQIRRSG